MKSSLTMPGCAVLGLVLLFGCGIERTVMDPVGYKSVSYGTEITEEEADQIVDGTTTKDDVYLMFGKPSEILEDGHVFVYNWLRGGQGNLLGFGGGSQRCYSLIITFDDDRVVKGHGITRGDFVQDAASDD